MNKETTFFLNVKESWRWYTPVKTERVEKRWKSFHQEENDNGEECPRSEDEKQKNWRREAAHHREAVVEYHVPQDLRQLWSIETTAESSVKQIYYFAKAIHWTTCMDIKVSTNMIYGCGYKKDCIQFVAADKQIVSSSQAKKRTLQAWLTILLTLTSMGQTESPKTQVRCCVWNAAEAVLDRVDALVNDDITQVELSMDKKNTRWNSWSWAVRIKCVLRSNRRE